MARYIPGGRVVLADGTYELGGSVNLNKQKAHLQGMGGATHLRPSTTGFDRLLDVNEVHVRVGYLLLLDTGDSQHDLRFALFESGQFWTIVDNVHTHGAEFGFRGSTGPAVIQLEFHGSSAGGNAGDRPIGFEKDADGFGCDYARVHGGWLEFSDREQILLSNTNKSHVTGVSTRSGDLANAGVAAVRLFDARYSTVDSSHVDALGDAKYGVHDNTGGTSNSILGNRIEGGSTQDLLVEGSGSLSAANFADGTIK